MRPCGFGMGRDPQPALAAGPKAVPFRHTKSCLETRLCPDRTAPNIGFSTISFN
ncbi:MAG: hypothetical protein JWP79_1365 [Polaromonas sp.]|jgi:hypothetical protein|nr:hypothetical protein [Polaromonas sp.]MDB5937915.1 hypothetical protein [Polaromonas sp.]